MGKNKTWLTLTAFVALVVAIVLVIVFVGQKNEQAKLAADLKKQVESVTAERDTLKADLNKAVADGDAALAAAKKDAEDAATEAKAQVDQLMADKDAALADAQAQIDNLNAEKATKKADVDKLIADKDTALTAVQMELEGKQSLIATHLANEEHLNKTVAELQAQIDGMNAEKTAALADADAKKLEIDKLIADKDAQIADLQKQIDDMNADIAATVAQMNTKKAEIDKLIADKDAQIADLQKQIDALNAAKEEGLQNKTAMEAKQEEMTRRIAELEAQIVAKSVVAYLTFADSSWTHQYWNDGAETVVTATTAIVENEGEYTVSLEFPADNPAKGVALLTLTLNNGRELLMNNSIDMKGILVNGQAVAASDVTTVKIDTNGTAVIVIADKDAADPSKNVLADTEAFAEVTSITVTFTVTNDE